MTPLDKLAAALYAVDYNDPGEDYNDPGEDHYDPRSFDELAPWDQAFHVARAKRAARLYGLVVADEVMVSAALECERVVDGERVGYRSSARDVMDARKCDLADDVLAQIKEARR